MNTGLTNETLPVYLRQHRLPFVGKQNVNVCERGKERGKDCQTYWSIKCYVVVRRE